MGTWKKQLQQLRSDFGGILLEPDDEGYGAARPVWNAMWNECTPALIARCVGVADVRAAILFATEQGLPIAVRGGGHSAAGKGTCDGGVVIDLSTLKGVRVDPQTRTAVVGGGCLWVDVDRETQMFGLATPGGVVSHTGVGGFALGGGFGWLSRRFGLTCDNVVAVDLVTADGLPRESLGNREPRFIVGPARRWRELWSRHALHPEIASSWPDRYVRGARVAAGAPA